jgi:hypothetical protein
VHHAFWTEFANVSKIMYDRFLLTPALEKPLPLETVTVVNTKKPQSSP